MNKGNVIIKDLSIGYGTGATQTVVAAGINATIDEGCLTCLLGANGVGKSTLLRTLAGFQPPLAGQIVIAGRSLTDYSDRELAQTVGVVLTEKPDVRNMTAEALVALGRSPYTGFWGNCSAEDRRIVGEAMEMVGITALRSRNVSTLSDGERQKVMIAKALAQQTPVICLDEPTAFLDYQSKADMLLLLRDIAHRARKTVFLSTHDVELALQLADTIWLMQRNNSPQKTSQSLIIGTPSALAADGSLAAFFAHPALTFDAASGLLRVRKD